MSLESWPTIRVGGETIYVADRPSLACRGLAGVPSESFGANEAVYFLHVRAEWGDFDNEDHGDGPVPFGIRIAFLDQSGRVLSLQDMLAYTGRAKPPAQAIQAIEARPEWFTKMGFREGRQSPVLVDWRPHRSRDPDDCYLHLCV